MGFKMRNIMTGDEINTEFRMIISHALLGSDISDIDPETWELLLDECTKFAISLMQPKKAEYRTGSTRE